MISLFGLGLAGAQRKQAAQQKNFLTGSGASEETVGRPENSFAV